MRLVPLLFVLLTLTTSVFAQQQEQKLMDRLNRNPQKDKDMVFDTRQASFSSGTRAFGTKSANSKSFFFKQKTAPGEFRSKAFAGSKSAWMGDFNFSTRQANTRGKYEVPNAARQLDTKTMAVADARESSKEMATQEFSKARRPYLGKEADKMKNGYAPGQEPTGWTGDLRPMTIDDVRNLLNKNK